MSDKYHVYGVGNALIDIVTEVDDELLKANEVEKGVMTLVDEKRQHKLLKAIDMKRSNMQCGGSAANTIIALSQFGGKGFYSSLVAKDELGKFFLEDLKRNGVHTNIDYQNCPEGLSGRCLVMTTPDAERTMNTFLGVSSFLAPEHLDEESIKSSTYVYMEGYLVASPKGLEALKEAKRIAERHKVATALTFSDPSMVKYFPKQMNEIVGASIDLLFCNEEEAQIFTGKDSLNEAREELKLSAKRFVITLGGNGAMIFDGDTFVQIEPYKVRAVDTNGAGDMFAGAFLFGITNGHSFADSGKLASLAASKVVSQYGPRLEKAKTMTLLAELGSR